MSRATDERRLDDLANELMGVSAEKSSRPDVKTSEPCSRSSQCSHDDMTGAVETVREAIAKCQDDAGALGTQAFREAAALIREHDPEEWFRLRVEIKKAKPSGVLLEDIDKATRPPGDGEADLSVADELVALVEGMAELFHDPEGNAYATVADNGARKTMRLGTQAFADWLSYANYAKGKERTGRGSSASDTSIKTAMVTLSGIAKHEGAEQPVYLRSAPWQNGYVIDLGSDDWSVVEVLPTGWRILKESPVRFWRPAPMRPIATPKPGGDLSVLWKFANVPEPTRPLVLAWLLEAWRADTPFTVLELCGSQGTAKSTTQDTLRQTIDPNAVNLRAAPKTTEDLFVSAGCNWLASFNNVSHLSAQQQDAICTLATGGGFASRTLYTNSDETLIECKRPVVLNGIVPNVTAQDLTDRVVHVELPEIVYREESAIKAELSESLSDIVGGLLDLFVATLKMLPSVKLDRLPRMADFAKLGEAMMQAQGNQAGSFSGLFESNRRDSVARGLDASPVATAVRELAEAEKSALVFDGTMKRLLDRLESFKPGTEAWPRSPRGLGDVLRRQAPALKAVGIVVTIGKAGRDGVPVSVRREHCERREHGLEVIRSGGGIFGMSDRQSHPWSKEAAR